MKRKPINQLTVLIVAALCLNGCTRGSSSFYNNNDACTVYGTCSSGSAGTSVWGKNVGTSGVWGN